MDIPPDVTEQYLLQEKATEDGCVYVEIWKGMYGLPQTSLLAQKQLENCLVHNMYWQNKHTPGLWTHNTRKIQFCLVVDDLGIKYMDKTMLTTSNKSLNNIMKSQQIGREECMLASP